MKSADPRRSTIYLSNREDGSTVELTPVPDGHYDLKSFSTDHERNTVIATSVFKGTQTGEGGPVPPTGNSVAAEYAYVMEFEDNKIARMTKIWNDTHSLKQLGWA